MPIKMQHPQHGFTFVSGGDQPSLEARGWSVCPPKAPKEKIDAPALAAEIERDIVATIKRKAGRPRKVV